MSQNTIYLITGANRGIGRGLVTHYLAQANTTVIAAVRDPSHPTAQSLSTLPTSASSTLIPVKIEATSETDPSTAIEILRTTNSITHLDVVVAVSAINGTMVPIASIPVPELSGVLNVNVTGTLSLFQATLPLLLESKLAHPKFVVMSAPLGSLSLAGQVPVPAGGYGISKAALNFLAVKVHWECPRLISFPLHPGVVDTDMAADFYEQLNGQIPDRISVEESVKGCTALIDGATREKTSGRFFTWEGQEIPL